MSGWIEMLPGAGGSGGKDRSLVLVTVAGAQGSTPREAGAKMVVTPDGLSGSIGGGHLEFKAVALARKMLAGESGAAAAGLHHFPLGPSLGQCCGGSATLLLENFGPARAAEPWLQPLVGFRRAMTPCVLATLAEAGDGAPVGAKMVIAATEHAGAIGPDALSDEVAALAREMLAAPGERPQARLAELAAGGAQVLLEPILPEDFNIVLFGAGHVGQALVSVLAPLPCAVRWIDGRSQQFPAEVPANVTVELSAAPEHEVAEAPAGSYFLVMTHSHGLDQRLCEKILKRGDFRYLGLIGSLTKRRRFEKRLLAKGLSQEDLGRLTCPIGVDGISGKHPAEIAIAVAAEILRLRERPAASAPRAEGAEALTA